MQLAHRRLHDPRDWDQFEEYEIKCTTCSNKVPVYFDPSKDDFIILGMHCRYCDTPYSDIIQETRVN